MNPHGGRPGLPAGVLPGAQPGSMGQLAQDSREAQLSALLMALDNTSATRSQQLSAMSIFPGPLPIGAATVMPETQPATAPGISQAVPTPVAVSAQPQSQPQPPEESPARGERITPAVVIKVARMCEDAAFVDSIKRLKDEQLQLERDLLRQRKALIAKHEDKEWASEIIGTATSASTHEIRQRLEKELRIFDRLMMGQLEQIQQIQQSAIAKLGVPLFWETSDPVEMLTQKKILGYILDMTDDETHSAPRAGR
ncbi:uncharacterized protein BJ171DRAFT_55575 [Polychytrium aggregatum]|uniref:uncharacterized protein n=1 Tax=Polychytrium aggregatum TaxID=110093 RepID=UPI0022FDECEC|nr:uncharacterized protein BJ171DRAFT_55575 [Polychytrium aggregatum]KAI9205956.1 hypothetical protein BJ171DRAFT_55575 [Polychytrium aggregatum]